LRAVAVNLTNTRQKYIKPDVGQHPHGPGLPITQTKY